MLQSQETVSKPEWFGSSSMKFNGSKKHLWVQDQLKNFAGGSIPLLGRKHFEDKFDRPKPFKSSLKLFEQHNKRSLEEHPPSTKQHYTFKPTLRPPRPERKHSYEPPQPNEIQLRGIKTFKVGNKPSCSSWNVEDVMQEKKRVRRFEELRNGIPVRTLGDKIYGYPDYSRDFFKGLSKAAGKQKTAEKKEGIKIIHYDKNAMTWKDRQKLEGREEDMKAVEELFKWEENVLAEANPNWKDPEKIGPPDLFAEREKAMGGAVKKNEPVKKK